MNFSCSSSDSEEEEQKIPDAQKGDQTENIKIENLHLQESSIMKGEQSTFLNSTLNQTILQKMNLKNEDNGSIEQTNLESKIKNEQKAQIQQSPILEADENSKLEQDQSRINNQKINSQNQVINKGVELNESNIILDQLYAAENIIQNGNIEVSSLLQSKDYTESEPIKKNMEYVNQKEGHKEREYEYTHNAKEIVIKEQKSEIERQIDEQNSLQSIQSELANNLQHQFYQQLDHQQKDQLQLQNNNNNNNKQMESFIFQVSEQSSSLNSSAIENITKHNLNQNQQQNQFNNNVNRDNVFDENINNVSIQSQPDQILNQKSINLQTEAQKNLITIYPQYNIENVNNESILSEFPNKESHEKIHSVEPFAQKRENELSIQETKTKETQDNSNISSDNSDNILQDLSFQSQLPNYQINQLAESRIFSNQNLNEDSNLFDLSEVEKAIQSSFSLEFRLLLNIDPRKLKENKVFSVQQQEKNKFINEIIKVTKVKKDNYIQVQPRDYQEEIFENCKDGNYIIYLQTGTGKTLVSLMLAYYTLQKYPNSKVAFLANQVNLVEQQYHAYHTYLRGIEHYFKEKNQFEIIKKAEDINISFYHGKMNVDFWNRQFWQKNINENQIVFFSSQVFLNGLRRGFFQISQFKQIIFDECHNTSKEHPFSQIMREFYFQQKEKEIVIQKTPFIIGLTATPITQGSKKNSEIRQEMLRLSFYLDSMFAKYDVKKVEVQLQEIKSTERQYKVKLEEEENQYIETNNIKGFENASVIMNDLRNQYPALNNLLQGFEKLNIQYWDHLSQPNRQLFLKVVSLMEEYLIILIYQVGIFVIQYFLKDIADEIKKVNIRQENAINIREILIQYLEFNSKEFQLNHGTLENISDKAKVLLIILQNNIDKEGLQLVFCNSKVVVKYINRFIQEAFKLGDPQSEAVYSDYIMGQSMKAQNQANENIEIIEKLYPNEMESLMNNAKMQVQQAMKEEKGQNVKLFELKQKYTDQMLTIKKFKNKQFRILISTSVAEEGFDIPQCTAVIAFSNVVSQRQYVQMKGRARAKNSEFFVLTPQCKNVRIQQKM